MKRVALFIASMFLTLGINAQSDNIPAPHMFVSLQGGMTYSYTHSDLDRKWAPMGALSFGGYFTKVVGARLQANGWMWNQDFVNVKDNLHQYYGGNADLLVNLTNIFKGDRGHLIDIVALGGLGVHESILEEEDFPSPNSFEKVKGNIWCMNARLGAQLGVNLSKAIALQVEGGVHKVFDGNNPGDVAKKIWPYAMVGVAYRFNYKKASTTPVPETAYVVEETSESNMAQTAPAKPVIEEKKPEPKPEPKPVVQKAPEKQTENVFFRIGRSAVGAQQAATVDQIAKWAKEHPQATILLTGYADKATGNARVNQALSERRAAAIKDALVKRGIKADRITTDAKGDTVQPFADNDKNRVVVAISEDK